MPKPEKTLERLSWAEVTRKAEKRKKSPNRDVRGGQDRPYASVRGRARSPAKYARSRSSEKPTVYMYGQSNMLPVKQV